MDTGNISRPVMLLTGATGFLGKKIAQTFPSNQIITLGRDSKSGIICDFTVEIPVLSKVDLVIHSAGKAHTVPRTAEDCKEFYRVNVNGTRNILKGLEQAPELPKNFVFISSVAVYGQEKGNNINEQSVLAANDPYGKSKIYAENLVLDWCNKNNVKITILRLPLIAGPNPPGNLKAMINGIKNGYYFNIDGGKAKKSVVLAADVAEVIPKIANIGGIFNLTDRYHPSFSELSKCISSQLNKTPPPNMPISIAKIIAKVGNVIGESAPLTSRKLQKITSNLTFDDTKARKEVGWDPTPVLEGFRIK